MERVAAANDLNPTRMLKAGAVLDVIGAVLCIGGVIATANLVGLV